mgnify:CR=1 FL=1
MLNLRPDISLTMVLKNHTHLVLPASTLPEHVSKMVPPLFLNNTERFATITGRFAKNTGRL